MFILTEFHSKLNLNYGSWQDEIIEQELCCKYINPNMKVLELGSNIGRVSMVIACILNKGNGELVTLETNKNIYSQLLINKSNNNLNFYTVNKALSYLEILHLYDFGNNWLSFPKEEISKYSITNNLINKNWDSVETITFEEIENQFKISFDTLVIDCEGAFYYILKSKEDILDNIKLIIIENDCLIDEHSIFILDTFKKHGFKEVDSCTTNDAWGYCKNFFWQVYTKE